MDNEVQETISRSSKALTGISFALVFLAGVSLGTAIAMKRLKAKYEQIVQEEIDSVKKHYVVLRNEAVDPEELAEQRIAEDIAEHMQYSLISPDAVTNSDIQQEAQDEDVEEEEGGDDWDLFTERTFRKEHPEEPYPITKQEFELCEKDYEQTTLTYFDGDNVLIDERDMPVPSIEATVGADNMTRFGYGSQDPNVIYIRNNRVKLDIEVVRDPGTYSEKVLGVIEHSDKPNRVRKFRLHEE